MASKYVDWEGVERDYRIGQMAVLGMAAKHGIAPQSITRRARKSGWKRDLTATVQAATNSKIIHEAAKKFNEGLEESARKDFNEVDLASNVNATLIMRHQKRADSISNALDSMISELVDASANPVSIDVLIEAVAQQDPLASDGIRRAQTLGNRMSIAKTASETLAKLVGIERQAFGLDADKEGGGSDQKRTALLIKDLDEAE